MQDAVWTLLDAPPIVSWSAMQEQAHQRGVAQALKDSVGLLYGADTAPVPRAVLLAEYRSSLEILGSPNCVSADEPPQQVGGSSCMELWCWMYVGVALSTWGLDGSMERGQVIRGISII